MAHLDPQPADAGSDLRARIQERVEQRRRARLLPREQPQMSGLPSAASDAHADSEPPAAGSASEHESSGTDGAGRHAAAGRTALADRLGLSDHASAAGGTAFAGGTALADATALADGTAFADGTALAAPNGLASSNGLPRGVTGLGGHGSADLDGRTKAAEPAPAQASQLHEVAPASELSQAPETDGPAAGRAFRTRPPAEPPTRRRHAALPSSPGPLRRGLRWAVLLVITAAAVVGLRQYVIASYYIPSASMETTLHGCPGCQPDMVLVDKLSYRFKGIARKDVVVFARPPQAPPEDKQLIKRVIGLPGEVVSGHDGHVFVNNKELIEPYVNPACHGTADFAPVRVPPDRYFVMGDNRCDSFDSRMFGAIPRSSMIGQAFAVIWPVHHLRWL